MTEELEILKEVCRRLERSGILYMITGSIASNLYAIPRMTRDIDIVIQIKKEDSAKLIEIFRDDFYIKLDSITEAVEKCGLFNIIHNESVFKVDLIVRKNSAYRELEFQRRRQMQMEGTPLWVVTPEDLILSKLFWAKDSLSELQLGDVRNLLRTLKDLDKDYLEKWVRSLGLEKIYAQVKGPRFASGSGGCQKPAASDTPGRPGASGRETSSFAAALLSQRIGAGAPSAVKNE